MKQTSYQRRVKRRSSRRVKRSVRRTSRKTVRRTSQSGGNCGMYHQMGKGQYGGQYGGKGQYGGRLSPGAKRSRSVSHFSSPIRYTSRDAPFCGPNRSYPVNTRGRARAAIAYAKKYASPKYGILTKRESDRIVRCARRRLNK